MVADPAACLAPLSPLAQERVTWPGGTELLVTACLTGDLPPLALITSVRCIVLRADVVLVVRNPHEVHVVPGGRREAGESLLETLRRQVLEETGWAVTDLRLLGCAHLRHLTLRPPSYPFPCPDFAHVVYTAEAAFLARYRPADERTRLEQKAKWDARRATAPPPAPRCRRDGAAGGAGT